jgi:phage terminase small subunit
MAAKPKLTPEQWGSIKATWEADPREGYAWLVEELALPVSAPGVRKAAIKVGWSKSNTPALRPEGVSKPSEGVSPKVSKVSAKTIKETIPKTIEAMDDGITDVVDLNEALQKTEQGKHSGLTPSQEVFVREYLIDLNATRAYKRAYPHVTKGSAETLGPKLLGNVGVSAAIEIAKDERADRTNLTADWVVNKIRTVANADARELIAVHVGCCRYCWGEGHLYQRTEGEMERDRNKHDEDRGVFDEQGGTGYSVKNEPNTDCPMCGGDGKHRIVAKDTRTLSAGAVALYAGAKEGKDGLSILTNDQSGAVEKLGRHMGIYEKDNAQKASEFTSLAALQVFADRMTASRERQRVMLEERRQIGLTGD